MANSVYCRFSRQLIHTDRWIASLLPMSSRMMRFGARLMIRDHRLGALLASFILLAAACPRASGDDLMGEKVAPFMKAYCFKCHNEKTSEGLLNLTKYTSSSLIARDFR